jgi:Arc/MetJ-type ribon-helix-helix transcriptional regulator
MDKADKVTIRLTADQAAALDFLVVGDQFKNRSDAIRVAIDEMTKEPEIEEGKITVDLPDGIVASLDKLVDLGHYRSRDLGIFELLRNGLEALDIEEISLRQKQRIDILMEKKAKHIVDDVYSNYVKQ